MISTECGFFKTAKSPRAIPPWALTRECWLLAIDTLPPGKEVEEGPTWSETIDRVGAQLLVEHISDCAKLSDMSSALDHQPSSADSQVRQ